MPLLIDYSSWEEWPPSLPWTICRDKTQWWSFEYVYMYSKPKNK